MRSFADRLLGRRGRWLLALGAVGLLAAAAIGAALCRFTDLNCHLREGDIFTGAGGRATGATELPAGFEQEVVAAELDQPTSFAFLPDGRILVGEKGGRIIVFRDGRRLPRPLVDFSSRLATVTYRGLLAVEPAPDFAQTGSLYVLYTYDPGHIGEGKDPTSVRVSRISVTGNRSRLATEDVVLGRLGGRSCNSFPEGADCIPCDREHCGGDIEFASDGSMFVSTGDGWWGEPRFHPNSLRAQNLDSLAGKVLRVTPEGDGRPDNPFWDGDPRSSRSRVWAYGFRNPFRMTLRPGRGTPYVGDVGLESFEEVDVAVRGGNFGWPCYEGSARPTEFERHPLCRALYARGREAVHFPLVTLPRGSVTGGAFYTAAAFPEPYRGAYFYGDWSWSWLRSLRVDAANRSRGDAEFATEAGGPVQIETGPDGALYYLALNAGELRRVVYRGD